MATSVNVAWEGPTAYTIENALTNTSTNDPAHAPHHNILPVEENSSSETWKTATIEEWLRTPDQDRRRITHEERRKASFHLCHAQLNNIPAQQRRLIGVMYDTGSVPKPHQQQPAESFTRPTKKKQRKTKGKKSDQVLQVRDENCAMLNVNKLREGHGRSRYVITEKHLQDNDYTKAPISVNLPMMLPEGMFHATLPRTASFQQSLEGIYVGTGAEEQSRKLVIERQEQSHPYGRIHIIRQPLSWHNYLDEFERTPSPDLLEYHRRATVDEHRPDSKSTLTEPPGTLSQENAATQVIGANSTSVQNIDRPMEQPSQLDYGLSLNNRSFQRLMQQHVTTSTPAAPIEQSPYVGYAPAQQYWP